MARPVDPEVLLEHAGWLRGLASELAGDPQRGDDAVQDTWLAYLRRPPRAAGGPGLRAWLARTVRHAALGEARARTRREQREGARARPAELPSVAESFERVELQRRIVSAVMALASPDREIVVLRFFEDVPPRDVAEHLSLSPNAVRTRLSRALGRLRAALDDTYGSRTSWAVVALPGAAGGGRALAAKAIAGGLAMKIGLQVLGAAAVVCGAWFALSGAGREVELEPARGGAAAPEPTALSDVEAPEAAAVAGHERVPDEPVLGAQEPPVAGTQGAPDPGAILRLEGRCVDELGRPLEHVRVAARRGNVEPQETAADGTFALELPWPPDSNWNGGLLYVDFAREGLADRWARARPAGPGLLPLPEVTMWRGGALAGRVVDAAGGPVRDVMVASVEPWPEDDERARDRARAFGVRTVGGVRTYTDDDGAYRLAGVPVETVRIQAQFPGRLVAYGPPIGVEAGREVSVPTIVLEEPAPEDLVSGTLVDPDGNPVSGARLEFRATSGDVLQQRVTWVHSDDGRFALLAARSSTYSLEASDPSSRWGPVRLAEVRGGDDVELRFPASGGRSVLFVHDSTGVAVVDYDVRLFLVGGAVSYADVRLFGPGKREITWPGEPFRMRIESHGFQTKSIGPLDPADLDEELDVELERAGGFVGVVLAGGEPVAGAEVHAHPVLAGREWSTFGAGFATRLERIWTPSSRTNADGSFFTPLPKAGSYVLHAVAPGYARTDLGPLSFSPGGRAEPLEIELRGGGSLAGRVLTAPGVSPGGWTIAITRGDGHVEETRVGLEGTYRFDDLPTGDWQVLRLLEDQVQTGVHGGWRAIAPDYTPRWDARVSAGVTTRHDLDFRDEVPCRVRGLVRIGGSPPAGYRVSIANSDTRKWPSFDPEGRYTVVLPRPDTYRLDVVSHSHKDIQVELTDERQILGEDSEWILDLPGGSVELVDLGRGASSATRRTFGLVRENDGTLRWFARIEASDDGRILLEHVPSGSYRWTEQPADTPGGHPGSWPTIHSFVLAPGGHETLRSP